MQCDARVIAWNSVRVWKGITHWKREWEDVFFEKGEGKRVCWEELTRFTVWIAVQFKEPRTVISLPAYEPLHRDTPITSQPRKQGCRSEMQYCNVSDILVVVLTRVYSYYFGVKNITNVRILPMPVSSHCGCRILVLTLPLKTEALNSHFPLSVPLSVSLSFSLLVDPFLPCSSLHR